MAQTITGKPIAWMANGREYKETDSHKEACITALEALESALQNAVEAGRIDCLHLTIKTFAQLQAVMVDNECKKYLASHPELTEADLL